MTGQVESAKFNSQFTMGSWNVLGNTEVVDTLLAFLARDFSPKDFTDGYPEELSKDISSICAKLAYDAKKHREINSSPAIMKRFHRLTMAKYLNVSPPSICIYVQSPSMTHSLTDRPKYHGYQQQIDCIRRSI